MTDNKTVTLNTLYAIKAGMTRIFSSTGEHIPVTVLKLIPNRISQVKLVEKDGYQAYQVAYGEKRASLLNKPTLGHLKKANIEKSLVHFSEVKVENAKAESLGQEVSLEAFAPLAYVDITGTSKGKGFQGVIKKFHFSGGPAAHGSGFHRTSGSIGNRATPGRVWVGKKMPGHMGDKQVTTQNLMIVEVNIEKGYMLIKGSVPGAKNSFVRVTKSK